MPVVITGLLVLVGLEHLDRKLQVTNVSRSAHQRALAKRREPLDVTKARQRAIRRYKKITQEPDERFVPRQSAAIITPSLYFTAITEVPVTIGDLIQPIKPRRRMRLLLGVGFWHVSTGMGLNKMVTAGTSPRQWVVLHD